MIVCLKTRFDEVHIINWSAPNGIQYTLCGKAFSHKQYIETFGVDNNFPDMCRNCYETQESINASAIENPREWSSDHVISVAVDEYTSIQKGWASTKSKYSSLDSRYWPKAKRMRRKFPAKEIRRSTRRYGITPRTDKVKRK